MTKHPAGHSQRFKCNHEGTMFVRSVAITITMLIFCSGATLFAAELAGGPGRGAIEMSEPEAAASEEPAASDEAAPAVTTPAVTVAPAVSGPEATDPREPDEAAAGTPERESGAGEGSAPEKAAEAASVPSKTAPDPAVSALTDKGAAALAPEAASDAGNAKTAPAGPAPWWRNFAYFIGIASDPRPGEVADQAPARPAAVPDYIIGPGDLLGISVWRDDNLTRTPVVLPDGKISFPLVGEVMAAGKTVAQLKGELEGKLTRYVSDAGLTVEVKQSNSMIIYIIGRVNVPGRQMLLARTNVLQALAMAGGLNTFAQKGEIKVHREEGGKTAMFDFNYDDVSEGRHLETNIELKRGDVIIVH
jgi:polysaccharide biosynthesis/export protein